MSDKQYFFGLPAGGDGFTYMSTKAKGLRTISEIECRMPAAGNTGVRRRLLYTALLSRRTVGVGT